VGTLVLSNIARSFGDVVAVRDVSFTVAPGTTFGLLGPNGAGKTTTMRMILGILIPDRGVVSWDGAAVTLPVRRRFGYLPEERGLYGKLKVRDQISYFGRLHGVPAPEDTKRADAWIERLGLGEYANRPCGELSKGNQQKVQIACAALHEPELLILDEPFSGLDPVNAETLQGVLRTLRDAGTTLILSSHQMWQIEDLCESFCVISGGVVRASGTLAELRAAWPTRIVEVEPVDAQLRGVLDAMPGARRLPEADRPTLAYEIPADADTAALLRRLVAAGNVTRFERVDPSLRDIYLRAIGAAAA
jgi:ABC-2 type transport system ATP-binding protein